MAGTQLVAGMKELTDWPSAGDEEVVAIVREEWCQCLMHPGLDKGLLLLEVPPFLLGRMVVLEYSYSSL